MITRENAKHRTSLYEAYCSTIRGCHLRQAEHNDCLKTTKNGMKSKQTVIKRKLSTRPSTGVKSYESPQELWEREQTSSIMNLLRWLNNEAVFPTLDAKHKIIFFTRRENFLCHNLVVHYQTWPTYVYKNIKIANFAPQVGIRKTIRKNQRNFCCLSIYLFYMQST